MAVPYYFSPDFKQPILLNGDPGTPGQIPQSTGPTSPAVWVTSGASLDEDTLSSTILATHLVPPPF